MTRREIETLFKTYYTRMYRLAASILYDEDESKDVVSEVFARLMASDVTLRPDTAEAYLLTGVRNQCRNVMERKQVRERFLRLLSEEATEPTITNSEQLRMTELMAVRGRASATIEPTDFPSALPAGDDLSGSGRRAGHQSHDRP